MTLIEDIRFDLSPKNGSLVGALISFFITIGAFVVAPYVIFIAASGTITDTGGTIFGSSDVLMNGAWGWVSDLMKYALPFIILSIPIGFYRAGSYARIPFKILFALYFGSWLWIAAHGGVFEMFLSDAAVVSGSASTIILDLDVRPVTYVMIMISFAMIFLAISEFGSNRKKYFEAIEKKKDTMSRRRARRFSG
ncbi:MAG: hypothetical protein LBE48_02335 [Methanomassiliicoccaceae archaeon]|jgi:hypothetical protein|nr:hypothetical protein [Methanomassiliicoccaceae archaeon]